MAVGPIGGIDPLTASVLDSAAEGALLLDGAHRVLHANAAAVRLLRRPRSQLEGQPFPLPLPAASADERWTALDGASPGDVELEVLASVLGVEPTRVVVWLRGRAEVRPEDEGLLDDLEELTAVGRWIWHPGTGETTWSAELHRILGVVQGEVAPAAERFVAATHPLDRPTMAAVVGDLARVGRMDSTRVRVVRPDGEVRTVVVTQQVAEHDADGRPARVEGWVQDVTRVAGQERLRRAARGAREVLGRWRGSEDAPALLAAVGEALDVAFAALWVPRQTLLHAEATWAADGFDASVVEREVRRAKVPTGVGYAGRAWASGRTVAMADIAPSARTRMASSMVAQGLRGGCVVPARTDHHVVAVLSVHTCEEGELGPADVAGLDRIAVELGREVERARRARRDELSPREVDVLRAIAAGRSTAEIAADLGIRTGTVRTHVEHLLAKLGARDRAAAVATAMRAGTIS